MNKGSLADRLAAEQERKLEELKKKLLDFSEVHAALERAEQALEEAKKQAGQVRS